jgi:amino acid transporter
MSVIHKAKRLLVGKPIATKQAHQERLSNIFGLPVFASDALSSTAYATEEVLLILVTASVAYANQAYHLLIFIAIALAILLSIVTFSYYQTIHAYPEGGGSYSVSKQNLGKYPGLVAAAALLIDYVLTVAVSVSAGVAALVSAFHQVQQFQVEIAVLVILFIAIINLRGARESGILFAIPTYSFVFFTLTLIAFGIYRHLAGDNGALPDWHKVDATKQVHDLVGVVGVLFVLKGFAGICTAMTGVEAISNGIQAFKPPETKNASKTLVFMASLLMVMVVGVSWCAQFYGIIPMHPEQSRYQTVLAQLADHIFGQSRYLGWMFYAIQFSTTTILFLAANTSFADFPRLTSLIARDKFLPRQLATLGDRLVFQNGIIVLASLAILLVVIFHAETNALIPLYAVGVFTAFTMSQTGMVVRWYRMRKYGIGMIANAIGALSTFVVTCVISYSKWADGAYIVVFAIIVVVAIFLKIRKYYDYLAKEFDIAPADKVHPVKSKVLLLIPRLHKGTVEAISYAKVVASNCSALHVTITADDAQPLREFWKREEIDMPLVILESPYRSLVEPVTDYIDRALEDDPDTILTVIVPQGVPPRWYQTLLHSNLATSLKLALSNRKNVVVTNVRYFL